MSVNVVIDPGHGGDNLGGNTDTYIEKELTLQVANYMKERLEMYDGVNVYLTHDNTTDPDLSRSQRAEIAADHDADFMFSLHFNMSEKHTLYGAEVWTSAFGSYYTRGQQFARIEMEALTGELGFFDRGIKTRIGKKGDDYYGIILGGKEEGIPTVIIEHCHMDEERDYQFLENDPNPYKTLGYLDADSVAKYFKLSSSSLGVDYSDYVLEDIPTPSDAVKPDTTAPENCTIELIDADIDMLTAHVKVSSHDSDSIIQYYQCSFDGGVSFGRMMPWNDDPLANRSSEADSITIEVPLIPGKETKLRVRAYNRFDLDTESDILMLPAGYEEIIIEDETDATKQAVDTSDYNELTYEYKVSPDEGISNVALYGIIGSVCVAMIASIALIVYVYSLNRRKRRRRRRR